ncbi:MAG: hypothetical protein WAT93_15125 [Pontixanthobacter sp.]
MATLAGNEMPEIGRRSLMAAESDSGVKPPCRLAMYHMPVNAMDKREITVAHAAPSMPRSSQKMKIGSSAAFTAPATSVTFIASGDAP